MIFINNLKILGLLLDMGILYIQYINESNQPDFKFLKSFVKINPPLIYSMYFLSADVSAGDRVEGRP